MLWIVATLIAAAAQTARNAMQNSLTATLGTTGASQVRFLYGFPFALLFLALLVATTGIEVPAPDAQFLAFTLGGAVVQILGTVLLIAAMQLRSFPVVTAFTKTEPVQVALFGLLLLDDKLTWLRVIAIVVATAGVFLIAVRPGDRWDRKTLKPALFGVGAGGMFALAAVGFRGGILALGDAPYFVRATTTLVWSLGLQTVLLGLWLLQFNRPALSGSLRLWKPSLLAGFMGALASQCWFLGFSLTAAVNVRTLALVEVFYAQVVARRVFRQQVAPLEIAGLVLVVAGVLLLLIDA